MISKKGSSDFDRIGKVVLWVVLFLLLVAGVYFLLRQLGVWS